MNKSRNASEYDQKSLQSESRVDRTQVIRGCTRVVSQIDQAYSFCGLLDTKVTAGESRWRYVLSHDFGALVVNFL